MSQLIITPRVIGPPQKDELNYIRPYGINYSSPHGNLFSVIWGLWGTFRRRRRLTMCYCLFLILFHVFIVRFVKKQVKKRNINYFENDQTLAALNHIPTNVLFLLFQEAYWRIPGHLSVATLNSYCNLLQEALDKTLTLEDNTEANTNQNNDSDDDEDIFDKLRETTKPPENAESSINEAFDRLKKSRSKTSNIENVDSSSDNDSIFDKLRKGDSQKDAGSKRKENTELEAAIEERQEREPTTEAIDTSLQKRKSRRIMDSDDENEDVDMNEQTEETEAESNTSVTKKGRHVIESDSEEEMDENDSKNGSDGKRIRSGSDSDLEKPRGKRSRIIESDNE